MNSLGRPGQPVDSFNPSFPAVDMPLVDGVPSWAHPSRRTDPYALGWWSGGEMLFWSSGEQTRRIVASGGKNRFKRDVVPADEAWERVLDPSGIEVIGAVMGAVLSYRTVTVEQLAAFTGYACDVRLFDRVWAMHCAGIVDLGSFASAAALDEEWRRVGVRPSKGRRWHRRLLSGLPPAVRWACLAGRGLSTGGQYSRHNILASELLLRVASFHDVVVAGEAQCLVKDLVGDFHAKANRSADGLIVCRDGARFAVEMTASSAYTMGGKVARWIDALHTGPDGLGVVFVDAVPVGANPRSLSFMKRMIVQAVEKGYSSSWFARAVGRIYAASWPVWFAPEGPTRMFSSLTVERYDLAARRWEQVDLLGGASVVDGAGFGPWLERGLSSSYVTPPWSRANPYPLWVLGPASQGVVSPPVEVAPHVTAGPPGKLMPARETPAVAWARKKRRGRR